MKSLIRWSATLGLVGTTVLGSLFTGSLGVLALTEQEIIQKLQPVPVFTITDPQGAPLVASMPNQNNQNTSVAGVFMSQRDAQAFVDRLKRDNPQLGNQVQVVPVSLAEVYQLDQQNQNQPNGLDFAFIPVEQEVQSAQALLNQNGQQGQQFQGVPLFAARGGESKGYLTIQESENGQQVIPFFFDKAQLQKMIDRFKQQQPNQAATVEIQVVSLEGVIQTLQTQNNPQLNNIVLVPYQESIDFVRSQSGQNPPNQPRSSQ